MRQFCLFSRGRLTGGIPSPDTGVNGKERYSRTAVVKTAHEQTVNKTVGQSQKNIAVINRIIVIYAFGNTAR
jgi:hypothetical protein